MHDFSALWFGGNQNPNLPPAFKLVPHSQQLPAGEASDPGKLGDDVKLIRMDANDINRQKYMYCEIKRKQSNNPT